jgi:hypothetical protein
MRRLRSAKLTEIEPGDTGKDLRTFVCPRCNRVQRHTIESAVTKAWLEPEIAIGDRDGRVVTYEVHNGRMIPKRPM